MISRTLLLSFLISLASITAQGAFSNTSDVFCDIIAKKAPATVIYEDTDIIVIEKPLIKNSYGNLVFREPANCLIVPKKHIVNIKDLNQTDPYDATILSKMGFIAQMLSGYLQGPGEFTLTLNNGKTSAQTVFHMHMHFTSPQCWKNPTWRAQK